MVHTRRQSVTMYIKRDYVKQPDRKTIFYITRQTNLAITTSQLLVWQTQAYIHSQHKNMYNIRGTCKQLRAYFTSYYMHTNKNIDA